MQYAEVTFHLSSCNPFRDLLVDALGNEGPYDSFVETSDGLQAYVPLEQFDESFLKPVVAEYSTLVDIQYAVSFPPDKNWNEEWEKQHQPVLVECERPIWVRAPFHEHRDDVSYEIEIEPKMSFGTAHHQTTYMMLSYLAELPLEGLRVLDMGCGTAVLGILAKMRGAAYVEGIDIDEWAYNNALENCTRNNVELNIRIGDASLLQGSEPFDLIIANINRNILLRDMQYYAAVLKPQGTLLLSGFYEHDIPVLQEKAATLGITLQEKRLRDSWAALRLVSDL